MRNKHSFYYVLKSGITTRSSMTVWWMYPYEDAKTGKHFDFEWSSTIATQCSNVHPCPFLSPSPSVWKGYNDLETLYPDIAKQWHPSKNGDLMPDMIVAKSDVSVWWHFPYDDPITGKHFDFEWKTTPHDRITHHLGCPYLCPNPSVYPGFNDFTIRYPRIAAQWHPTKNAGKDPTNLLPSSFETAWWLLHYQDERTGKSFKFEWQDTIRNRCYNKSGCPYLNNRALYSGFNDLTTTHPDIAAQWHPTKNGELKPEDFFARSDERVWWFMPYDDPITGKHFDFEWHECIDYRCLQNPKCPYLTNKLVWPGYNDLESNFEDISSEWHYEQNKPFIPSEIYKYSREPFWWKCEFGHKFFCSVSNRTKDGRICPTCKKKNRGKFFG